MPQVEILPTAALQTEAGTQMRVKLSTTQIQNYVDILDEAIRDATGPSENMLDNFKPPFPAVVAFRVGDDYILADGFQRLEAYKKANIPVIPTEVHEGTLDDAILYSLKANATHGLPRTYADRCKAVETVLRHPVWKDWSHRKIAEATATHVGLVKQVMDNMGIEPSPKRIVERGGTQYTQDVTGIQQAAEQRKAKPEPQLSRGDMTDEEWLGTLPILADLIQMSHYAEGFRRDALIWRTMQQRGALEEFNRHFDKSFANYGDANSGLFRFLYPVRRLAPPEQWEICSACKGYGCEQCGDAGYQIP